MSGEEAWRRVRVRGEGATHRIGLALAMVAGLVALSGAFGGEQAAGEPRTLRPLKGKERREASEARRGADELRAAYEAAYGSGTPNRDGQAEALAEAEAAYKAVIAKYAGTEVGGYCWLRLAGLYGFAGQRDRMEATLKELATEYAGTAYEAQAYFTTGLMHLQGRHDPAAAIPWFDKVAPPAGAGEDGVVPERAYNEAHVLYISAQQSLAKCEVRLGRPDEAARRCEALGKRYPQYRQSFDKALRFQVRSALSDHTLVEIKPILAAWLKANP